MQTRTILSLCFLVSVLLMRPAIASQSPVLLTSVNRFPPMSRGTDYYFNEVHQVTRRPPECFRWVNDFWDSRPYKVVLRGTLVERTFYGPPWVTDTGTPHGVLLMKLDRPLSICGIPASPQSQKKINEGGITGLYVLSWFGFSLHWSDKSVRLDKPVDGKDNKNPKSINNRMLGPYLNSAVQISGYLSASNFATPWAIEVTRACIIAHGRLTHCRDENQKD